MNARTQKPEAQNQSPVTEATLETAADMQRSGVMSDADYAKITMRHLGRDLTAPTEPVSPAEIRSIRERAASDERRATSGTG